MADPYSGIQYFPKILPANTVVGRLGAGAGIAEAIPISLLALQFADDAITPETYGAVGDAIASDTAAITSGQHRVTDTSAAFTSADVGKTYGIMGAGAAGITHISTISAFVDATHVDLTNAAGTTVSNAHSVYGTDDSIALAAFFGARLGKNATFSATAKGYISTAALTGQVFLASMNRIPLYFLIGNHTDNCFTMAPVVPLVTSQSYSRYTYDKMWLDCMATGLDGLFTKDGSPNLQGLVIKNAYRDAVYLQPDGTGTPITAIENLVGIDWLIQDCGRHAIHLYLKCKNDLSVQTYINESLLDAIEVRGIGRRFGTGGAGTATAANLIRLTYDTCVVNLTQNKVSTFKINGNFDARQATSLGGGAVGDVIYHNAINGTTCRQVEHFDFIPGGIESSDGTLISGSKVVTGSAITAGDWIECDIEMGVPYQWGLTGLDNALLSSAADGNSFLSNNPAQGAMTYKLFKKRPTTNFAMVSADAAPNGGIIDPGFKNVLTPYLKGGNVLPAGSAVNVDIPIYGLPAAATYTIQYPMIVDVYHSPYYNDLTKASFGRYLVMMSYDLGVDTAYISQTLIASKVGADAAFTFTPASGVTFSIQSSSGTLRNRLRCAVTGGASVGTAGALTDLIVCASRWGMGISELQRVAKGVPSALEMNFTT